MMTPELEARDVVDLIYIKSKDIRSAVQYVINTFDDWLSAGKKHLCDLVLQQVDPNRLVNEVCLTLLVMGHQAAADLPHYEEFKSKVRDVLLSRVNDIDRMLYGL